MTPPTTPTRTLDLEQLHIDNGAHSSPDAGMCVMEAVAFIAGEPHSDHPACASKVIGSFLRTWNDSLPDDDRQQLKQYIGRLVGSAGTPDQENQRAWMATDWLARVQAPAWLRLAGLDDQADVLAGLTELTPDTVPSIRPALEAARSDATAAWAAAVDAAVAAAWAAALDAAWDAARAAARAAARDAAWAAAGDAARDAAWAAAVDAAGAAAGDAGVAAAVAAAVDAAVAAAVDAAGAAAWDAARDAAWAAAGAAARARLQPTRDELIDRAHELVDRMLAVTSN